MEPLPPLRIRADQREIEDFPKLPSANSFIREMLDRVESLHNCPHCWSLHDSLNCVIILNHRKFFANICKYVEGKV